MRHQEVVVVLVVVVVVVVVLVLVLVLVLPTKVAAIVLDIVATDGVCHGRKLHIKVSRLARKLQIRFAGFFRHQSLHHGIDRSNSTVSYL